MPNLIDPTPAVMVVDDDPRQITAYQSLFSPQAETGAALSTLAQLVDANPQAESANPPPTFSLLTAQQGDEAVAVFAASLKTNQPVRVAFIDMRMPPGMNGLQTAEKLRALDPRVYIVIVTAYTDVDMTNISDVLQEDVLFVRKPFQAEEVMQIARNFCQAWARDRELTRLKAQLEQNAECNLYEAALYEVSQGLLADMADKINAQSGLLAYLSTQFKVELTQQPDFEQLTGTVLGEARQLSRLVNALQRLSEESDQVSVFSVRDLIEQLQVLIPSLTPDHQEIRVCWELDVSEHKTLHTCFSRLVLAVAALLDNAEEAVLVRHQKTAVPYCQIHIQMAVEMQTFVLSVTDNGVGCRPGEAEHFLQAGFTRKPGHAGMGLTMVAQFVEQVGGHISLDSPGENRGMRAQLRFPLNFHQ
ncbi:MAG: hybrid sensor histidine kinase/response regulator [Hydrogenovibrio sp.]|uniref:hybrid sensor histidine kinase/response regulator n=1 Tax=Hydrogenovibrio sp. TaxID=2065821 RepID=UPI0028701FDD|nr:hybrid sensor histidine kinase/response regulator [Hydrogenovibrio sp.]MDR9499531.1 hybrid sensor histidine kinase/response regulator [Hydrogenovibrio sp.]